jgi:hypothetical protein
MLLQAIKFVELDRTAKSASADEGSDGQFLIIRH